MAGVQHRMAQSDENCVDIRHTVRRAHKNLHRARGASPISFAFPSDPRKYEFALTVRKQGNELKGAWSLLSRQKLNRTFCVTWLPPPNPSLKLMPARGPLNAMLPCSRVCQWARKSAITPRTRTTMVTHTCAYACIPYTHTHTYLHAYTQTHEGPVKHAHTNKPTMLQREYVLAWIRLERRTSFVW